MKVCIVQPAYSTDYSKSEYYFEKQLELLEACDGSMDLIVLPEACDIPCLAKTREESEASAAAFNKRLLEETKMISNAQIRAKARELSVAVFSRTNGSMPCSLFL